MIEQLSGIKHEFIKTWKAATNNGKNILKTKTPDIITPTPNSTTDTGNNSDMTTVRDSVDSITGSARQVRNLTVNIDSFNKGGINTANTTLKHMEPAQIEEWFTEMCMRIVRSIETTY